MHGRVLASVTANYTNTVLPEIPGFNSKRSNTNEIPIFCNIVSGCGGDAGDQYAGTGVQDG